MVDIYGKDAKIDGLRDIFSTYDAAESYARKYRRICGNQYHLRVKGVHRERGKWQSL